MAIIEKNIKSNCDGLNLGITIITPAKNRKVKAIVQLVHSAGEHRKKYIPFMNFLSKKGYVCIIHDLRGYGNSIKKESDLGYFYDSSVNYIVDDTYQVTELIKSDYPDKEVILFGHGMGSLIVRNYIQKYDSEIKKLIVCGSISNNKKVWLELLFVNILEKIKGSKYRSLYIHKLTFQNYKKTATTKNLSSILKEENNESKEDIKSDDIFTLNECKNFVKLLGHTYSKKRYQFNNKDLKVLFISGVNDINMISEDAFYESCDFLTDIGYNVSHILYKDAEHDLLNEDINDIVYQDILEFIEEK